MRSPAATRCCASSSARWRGEDVSRRRHPRVGPDPASDGRSPSASRHGDRTPSWKSARSSAARRCPICCWHPQLVVTLVFFYWPASQAVWQSFLLQDAFGLRTDFVWLENYRDLFAQADYYRTMGTTAIFSIAVAALSLSIALHAGGAGRQAAQGCRRLQDAADLALCGRAGDRRRAVALHVPALARRGGARHCARSASTGTRCSTATTP